MIRRDAEATGRLRQLAAPLVEQLAVFKIGRASCRARV